jgi:DNA-binding MarR family transcriptional regulator
MSSAREPRWLTTAEQHAWRSWIAATLLLDDRLERDMQELHGLSMADYEILVQLSEHPERRLRMSELAQRTLSSRSRLSHQITRMEKAGLVERAQCDDDGRGTFAVLTEQGWQAIVAAAPDHVDSVRRHLIEPLGAKRFAELGDLCSTIAEQLMPGDSSDDS